MTTPMLSNFRSAGLIWPTLFALLALVMLVSLGNWQLNRKAWKDGLIAQIETGLKAEPVEIGPSLAWDWGRRPQHLEYKRLKTSGQFLHSQERRFYALGREGPGWHIITPMLLEDGKLVLVNRGYVPETLKSASSRIDGQVAGRVEVTGLLRMGEEHKAMFVPSNDHERNTWFWRDVRSMLRCENSTGTDKADCDVLARTIGGGFGKPVTTAYPFIIDAEAEPANSGGWPRGGTTNLNLPNKHLEYAVTWYGLALTLIGVYAAFAWGRLRGTR